MAVFKWRCGQRVRYIGRDHGTAYKGRVGTIIATSPKWRKLSVAWDGPNEGELRDIPNGGIFGYAAEHFTKL